MKEQTRPHIQEYCKKLTAETTGQPIKVVEDEEEIDTLEVLTNMYDFQRILRIRGPLQRQGSKKAHDNCLAESKGDSKCASEAWQSGDRTRTAPNSRATD